MIKLLDLFAGIGAVPKALSNLGVDYEIVDAVEIDKYAVKSYNAIHGTNFEPQDITKWDKNVEVDLISHGSPCTDFSIIGKQLGGDFGSGTRSSLMYETLRIVQKLKPKYVLWENVKNLLSKKHIHNFENYVTVMDELGYTTTACVLNAKNYGVPQNRERMYAVSIRKDIQNDFKFIEECQEPVYLKSILESNVEEKYYLSEKGINYVLDANNVQVGTKWEGSTSKGSLNKPIAMTIGCRSSSYQRVGITNYICDDYDREVTVKELKEKGNLTSLRIRKLTPRECFRAMGFSDIDFDKARPTNSDSQLYKQIGNSIVVNVLMNIFKELFKNE